MKDTAVLINELGEAGLDHILARTVESEHIADKHRAIKFWVLMLHAHQ